MGVEIELMILDHKTRDLASGAPLILEHFDGDERVKAELLDSIIEINTGICENVQQARSDLVNKLDQVTRVANENGMDLMSMGTHPFARWSDAHVTRTPRYQAFLERMQFPVRRLLITGVHVHIGIESGEKADAVVNSLRRYIPHFIGLSANSPFWDGSATGLASTRMKVFEGMPTAGLPYRLTNYTEFQRLMRTLQRANALESVRELWWDIRPHPGFGTVEVRLFDAVPSIDEMVALAALTQCMVVALSEYYDNAQQLPDLSDWVVRENKWRAVRYGIDADIIVDDEGHSQSLRSSIHEILEKLEPFAARLGCTKELYALQALADGEEPPYKKQLRRFDELGNYEAIIEAAIEDLQSHKS